MRSVTVAAIATFFLGLASLFNRQMVVQAITPAPKDVVVEIKLAPGQPQPQPGFFPKPEVPAVPAPFPSFNSQQLDRQLQRYITYIEQNGVPDVLILGSSRALQGVDPLVLKQTLEQQGYSGVSVFNFGINGATAQVVDWLLHRLLPPDQLPRLLVWADGSRAFNSGRIDHTFNKIRTSEGNRQLLAGKRPLAKTSTGLKVGQLCMDLLPVQIAPQQTPQVNRTSDVPKSGSASRSQATPCKQPIKLVVHQSSLKPQSAANALDLGFQTVSDRFNPNQYFQRYPKVSGSFDADYRNFALTGTQAKALDNVSQFANRHKIPLVFVNLPLTATYRDYTRSTYEDEFRRRMQWVSQTRRFTFIDLSTVSSLSQNSYFADPSHLNRLGAVAVAQELGREFGRLRLSLLPQRQSQNHSTISIHPLKIHPLRESYLTVRVFQGNI
ncbi:MAG: hypothetical protein NW224_25005 [Leptolyngbyaceae cyanobacterium bins.302]|nr:hypothetical protein [Leptolyngbyaceae cyanobacterium bins.302]